MIADEHPHARRTSTDRSVVERDGHQHSLWQDTTMEHVRSSPGFPTTLVDVVVVGAGITGVSTALELQQAGQQCALVEARNTGSATTGGTSAHINTRLELSYDRMIITPGSSAQEKVFDPARGSPVARFSNFVKEAVDGVQQLTTAPFPAQKPGELDDLYNGEGRVVQYGGRSIAMHRDDAVTLHALSPSCTHIQCTVAWHKAERSWDRPCHGPWFATDGSVPNAPARKPLQRLDIENGTDPHDHQDQRRHAGHTA